MKTETRKFTATEAFHGKQVRWVMDRVKASPLTGELFLEDGETVEVLDHPDHSKTITITKQPLNAVQSASRI